MYSVNRSAILTYSAEQMYSIVKDIEAYPDFLPWCNHAQITSKQQVEGNEEVVANVGIAFSALKQSFSTKNTNTPYQRIDMKLLSGPFSHLHGTWLFHELNNDACKVELVMEFDFSSKLMAKMVAPVFEKICINFIDAFKARAQQVYGSQ